MVFDAIVVGTGAGGATVAKELACRGLKVLILEKGNLHKAGTAANHIRNINIDFNLKIKNNSNTSNKYDFLNYPADLLYVEGVGGTTPVSLGNACFACSACYSNAAMVQFKVHDLNLFEEIIEASKDLKVNPLPANLWGPATRKIVKAGENLGYFIEPMPKFIDFSKCDNCGLCLYSCKRGAKWDATHFIKEALTMGATLISDFEVIKVLHHGERVRGVEGISKNQESIKFKGTTVVLAAGTLNTPQILRNSGISEGVGEGLFTDLFITAGGVLKNANLNREIPMGVKSEFGPYFLSPHFSNQLVPLLKNKGFDARPEDVLGIMVKIADEANGILHSDGSIKKSLTKRDLNLLKEGYDKCVEILTEAGVNTSSIVSTPIRGAHPGGTAPMGKVVNNSFETHIKGLFISDASVIPQAPGRPPILTITALAKRISKNIVQSLNIRNRAEQAEIYGDI